MIFQTFDDKKECIAIYANDKLYLKNIPKKITQTWDYSEILESREIEYAKYYCEGKSLNEVCPEHLKKEWEDVCLKLKAFHRAVNEAKLDLHTHCFFDLMPKYVLNSYGQIKNKICSYIFAAYKKPENYDFMVNLAKALTEIKNTKLNIDLSSLDNSRHKFKVRQFLKKINKTSPYIIYDARGTKTGRLTAKQFPILTMDKTFRKILYPNNKWFLEFDYNAAELRVLLALSGKEQPLEDMHDWNLKNVYQNVGTRERAKKRIFAWLYNPKSQDYVSNKAYSSDEIIKKYYDGNHVLTFFNRKILSDEHHALNYIIQSTAADLFLRQMIKIRNFLSDKKSRIAFCLHDSLIIDLHEDDEAFVNEIKELFAETELGKFKVNTYGGTNFGEMKRMNVN